jgi:hypothetical protein
LVPRFKVIPSLMDTIQALMQQNAVFETEIKEIGTKNSILNIALFGDDIKKGLTYLKTEGWLTEKEHGTLIQRISQ